MRLMTLTDEQRASMSAWRDQWIASAMSTRAMDDEDRAKTIAGLKGLYEAAGLPWHGRVVFVPSPFVLRIAAGFSAAIWRTRKNGAVGDAVDGAVGDAVDDAVDDAVSCAVDWAVYGAVSSAVGGAVYGAVRLSSSVVGVTADEIRAMAGRLGVGEFGLRCAKDAWRLEYLGAAWSGWAAYVSFFRSVVRLDTVDFSKWAHMEDVVRHAGRVVMHADFCMVSDRPSIMRVDAENRPHSDAGPYARWRDGTAIYRVHGVECPAWVIEHPERITTEAIDAESNAEVRRVMIDKYGVARYLAEVGTVVSDGTDETGQPLTLYRRAVPDDEPIVMLRMLNSTPDADGTRRAYMRRVPPDLASADQWRAVLHPSKHDALPAALRKVPHPNIAIEARNWVCRLLPGSRIDVQT